VNDGIVTASFHGSKFSLLDIGGTQCDLIAQGAIYEPALLEWVYQQRFRGMAYDVGANIGNHTLWFSEICHMEVYAFEPVEHQILLDNINLNKAGSRVRVFRTALGADFGRASEKAKCTLQTDEGDIPVVPMDSVKLPKDKKLSLIKIDVEGMEVAVLQGGMQTIRSHKPVILTEEWERETTQGIMKLLTPLGYEKFRSFGGRGRAPVGAWVAK
jgi:FkbM family methyltransferase